jgi:hypothetical protein
MPHKTKSRWSCQQAKSCRLRHNSGLFKPYHKGPLYISEAALNCRSSRLKIDISNSSFRQLLIILKRPYKNGHKQGVVYCFDIPIKNLNFLIDCRNKGANNSFYFGLIRVPTKYDRQQYQMLAAVCASVRSTEFLKGSMP